MSATRPSSSTPIRAIMVAVLVWGTLIAIGTIRFSYDAGQPFSIVVTEPLVVLATVTCFLVLWALMLRAKGLSASYETLETVAWSVPCIIGLTAAIPSAGFLLLSRIARMRVTAGTQWIAWIAMVIVSISVVMALIGLSNPRPVRGKWMGIVTISLFLAVLIGWLWPR